MTPSACAASSASRICIVYSHAVGDREPPLPVDDARQRLPLEELHHDVRVTVGRAIDVDDLHDVGAADLGRDARLLQEALDEPGAARELRVQHLDGDAGPQDGVQRLVDRAHPAVPEDADEPVLAVDDAADVDHEALAASLASPPPAPGGGRARGGPDRQRCAARAAGARSMMDE